MTEATEYMDDIAEAKDVVNLPTTSGLSAATILGSDLKSRASSWDPTNCPQWDKVKATDQCLMRIKNQEGYDDHIQGASSWHDSCT